VSDFLKQMAASSAARAETLAPVPASALDCPVVPLAATGFGVIAEIKGRSPAEGALGGEDIDHAGRAGIYADAGAAAISVLTEPTRFSGAIEHLSRAAAAAPHTPVMRKDFLVAPSQVVEARAAGASGVLLIVAMLDDRTLRAMLDCASEHGLFVLLESFDTPDLERARRVLGAADEDRIANGQLVFGVNTRNLRTLEVDAGRLERLVPGLPEGRAVAESGIATAADAAGAARLGYDMVLVGSALMRSDDPGALVAAMRAAGRAELAA
jgi:indole-3-glycerol phosphate synthase